MLIEELDDFPSLQQLARALWKTGEARGAAILVGAGFSRNAERIEETTPEPPLWTDLAAEMVKRIYPNGGAPNDQLRLAEEYKAVLGESALESLIKELIRDEELLPGQLHRKLVGLPWTDILTTNWDTLIERAALENLGQTYETVCCIGDISTTRAPRVVKLHGSFPSNRPFIISQEDYRTYPKIFAPFVNLVQQVFLENELCLLGFSGDDPNFLEWSGWIRDQLGASARRIYLIGALNLAPSHRRLLEARSVSAVDLSPLVTNESSKNKHKIATEKFIDYLLAAKPKPTWDWPQTKTHCAIAPWENKDKRQTSLIEMTQLWASQRLAYPGWVICPGHIRATLRSETVTLLYSAHRDIEQLSPLDKGNIIFELLWRADILFINLPSWASESFRAAFLDEQNWANREIRQFVGAFLLRSAREERNLPLFDEIRTFFNTNLVPDQTTETCILYERCLWARDELDFRELRNLLPALAGVDPIWRIRRAALYCDLGDLPAARENVAQGLREIRERFYRNRDSLSLVSRIAWAQFLSRTLRPLESMGQEEPPDESDILHLRIVETRSDPWDVIANLEREIEESVRKVAERMRTKEPQFEAGVYKDNSSTLHFGSWAPQDAIYEAARIVDIAGAPARADHFQVMSSRLERAEAIAVSQYENEIDYLRLLRVVQAGSESLLKEAFGRIQIARLSEANFGMLWRVLNRALEYAVDQIRFRKGFADDSWSRRAAIYAELLSRLSVRLDDTRALALFKSSLQSANDPRWRVRELLEPLENLLIRSLSAVPPPRRSQFILDILEFPLPDEAGIGHPFDHDWPDSFKLLSMITAVRPQRDAEFASRIDVLIDKTQNCPTEVRSRAVRLLTKLYMDSVLTDQESLRFGNALWARRKSIVELPSDTTLYSHIFLLLPSPEPQETIRSLVMARCHELTSSDNFISLASASQKRADGKPALLLTKEEATAKLAGILAWHPRNDDNPFHPVVIENRETRRAIGAALANAIFPALSPGDLTDAQVQDCMSHLEKELDYSAAQALPQFLRIAPTQTERVIKLIIRSMVSPKSDCAWAGFNAIYRWLALTKDNSVPAMPRKLIDTLLAVIETNRKPGLLHAINIAPYLIGANLLARDDRERIADALGLIKVEADYVNQDFSDDGAITLTLLRASAVKLAHALSGSGIANSNVNEWLRTATTDPIPEVRFAFITPEELS